MVKEIWAFDSASPRGINNKVWGNWQKDLKAIALDVRNGQANVVAQLSDSLRSPRNWAQHTTGVYVNEASQTLRVLGISVDDKIQAIELFQHAEGFKNNVYTQRKVILQNNKKINAQVVSRFRDHQLCSVEIFPAFPDLVPFDAQAVHPKPQPDLPESDSE